jgi:hypothetical protein
MVRNLRSRPEASGPTVTPIDLRRRIRRMIERGTLPALADRHSRLGQGRGETCPLCGQPITTIHWAYEVLVPPVGEIRAHAVCFRIWAEESAQLRKTA